MAVSALRAKRAVAHEAMKHVRGHALVGIGTGSTVDEFIDLLGCCDWELHAVIASSRRSADRLRSHGIAVLDPTEIDTLPVYVDGADEADGELRLLKGAGGAATREKLLASAARTFVCIADDSKFAERLGARPVAVEVLAVAEAIVMRGLRELGGTPLRRVGFLTDDGNPVLDVTGLPLADDPLAFECALDSLPGVVGNGIFAARPADVLLLADEEGTVRTLTR